MSKLSGNRPSRDWANVVVFLAILVTGILYITLGHLTAGSLTTTCAALVGVYGAWRHFR